MADNSSSDTPALHAGEIDCSRHEFSSLTKEIRSVSDMAAWEKCEAYHDLVGFIMAMNEAVKNVKLTDTFAVSQNISALVDILNSWETWLREIPPLDQPQRFGNTAFRDWFARVEQNAECQLEAAFGEKYKKAAPEIACYLKESVGNSTRIDYGTGHEFAFAAFLCCLYKIGFLKQEDATATVLKLFNRYLEVMRGVQLTYRMEPAGSQGVRSLDDHHFLPFYWGSSQLIDHKYLSPTSFPEPDIATSYAKDYMFLACIKHIHKVKKGQFSEHSNSLWNVSGVKKWSKVNSGLMKMYKAEVLAKFPVMQHVLFGSLLRWTPVQT